MIGDLKNRCSVALAVSTVLLAGGTVAHAQTGSDATGPNSVSSLSNRLHLAEGAPADSSGAAPFEAVRLDEVVVTAEKRTEQLLTVPVPVTALDASTLLENNQLRLQDYFTMVPGLQLAPNQNHGAPQLAIRGIVGGQGTNPTVGITIDGVPYGSSLAQGGGNVAPDIDPSELARVEVLKGPQGTLYGANTLGGLLQYVTINPDVNELTGHVNAGVSEVENGDDPGYNARGSVNMPINDSMAVRASGFARRDPGYIDDPTHGQKGVNEVDVYGAHVAAMWRVSSSFSAKFSALFQHSEQFATNYADIIYGISDLQQNRLPGTGGADSQLQNYSLTLDGQIGTFDLTSISSYNASRVTDAYDDSTYDGVSGISAYNAYGGFTVTGVANKEYFKTEKLTEELRLSTPIGSHVDWLFGVFYTHEHGGPEVSLVAADINTGAPAGLLEGATIPILFQEYAAFTDFTFKLTSRFDVQVGARESKNKQKYVQSYNGPLGSGSDAWLTYPEQKSDDNSFTYLLTPRYTLVADKSTNVMAYARFASGYRPGGPNLGVFTATAGGPPATFGPDKTQNYDLGLKAALLARTLFLDLSLFYIDWKDIQLSEIVNGLGVYVNGNTAKSQGVELQTEWTPLSGLTIDVNATYDDAELTEALPDTAVGAYAPDGSRLPFTAKFSGSLAVNQDFPIASSLRGFVGGQLVYLGGRDSLFAVSETAPRQTYPAFAQLNLRAGVSWKGLRTSVFATNLTNRRGELSGGLPETPQYSYNFITPRTVGLEFTQVF